jgi:hypothetical protein
MCPLLFAACRLVNWSFERDKLFKSQGFAVERSAELRGDDT